MLLYDPPSGWKYGFPKPYKPVVGESLSETLIKDGYPEKMANDTTNYNHCRFMGSFEEYRDAYFHSEEENK